MKEKKEEESEEKEGKKHQFKSQIRIIFVSGHSNNYCLIRFADTEDGKKWTKQISLAIADYEATKAMVADGKAKK